MILNGLYRGTYANSILHVCGDDPDTLDVNTTKNSVFSTYVEMILAQLNYYQNLLSILHVCGDDP